MKYDRISGETFGEICFEYFKIDSVNVLDWFILFIAILFFDGDVCCLLLDHLFACSCACYLGSLSILLACLLLALL